MYRAPFSRRRSADLAVSQSALRIVHSEFDVKSSAAAFPPGCSASRPAVCPSCGAAGRPVGARLVIVGHGLRERTVEGPLEPGGAPVQTSVVTRRYLCRACRAVLVVVPRDVGRGSRYSLSAIAGALALWAYARRTAAETRSATSTAKVIGTASATRWASLRRWTRCALALFGVAAGEVGTLRERPASIASFCASHALSATGPVPVDTCTSSPTTSGTRSGCERELFNSDALALVHEQAQGRLRELDRICTDALKRGAKRKLRVIDRDLIVRVLGDAEEPLKD